jgi:tRNA nucleotidyltransferase (CCA-adding enzyme)
LARLDVLRYLHPELTEKVDYSKCFDEARRAMDWYDLLYTGHPCERWLCYFLVFTASLDRAGIKSFCERLKITPRYSTIFNEERGASLLLLKKLEARNPRMSAPRASTMYRWFHPLSTEILLFLMANASKEHVRQWISHYMTHLRDLQPLLRGDDLEMLGISPGPVYRTILDELLFARLDNRVVTADDERALVVRKYQGVMNRAGER